MRGLVLVFIPRMLDFCIGIEKVQNKLNKNFSSQSGIRQDTIDITDNDGHINDDHFDDDDEDSGRDNDDNNDDDSCND